MKRSPFTSRIRAFALGVLCLTAPLALQAQEQILAPGKPRLSAAMARQAAGFFEWGLDLHFTPAQAEEYQQMLIRDWADPRKRKATLDVLRMMDKAATVSPELRSRVQSDVQKTLLEGLRKADGDPESNWMLAVYDSAHAGSAATALPAADPTNGGSNGGSGESRRLAGKWRASSVAAIQYQNSYTGAPAPTSGHSFFYEFSSDGTYKQNGLLQMTTYGCTSSVYRENSGEYRVEGDRLYIQPRRGFVRSQVCGGRSSENQDKLELST